MTLKKWVDDPIVLGNDQPFLEGHGDSLVDSFGRGSKPMVPFWGRCTTHFQFIFCGDWSVHWGYGVLTHGHL